MSGIANLYNVPSTPEEWAEWQFAHAAHHVDINRLIYELSGISLPEFVLDPFNPNDPEVWLSNHQIMHTNQDAILSISPFNLAQASFRNAESSAGWIFLNATEHRAAADALNLG